MILGFFEFSLVVMSIILHELSHGFVAYLRGDPTAKRLNRLSLNPLRHIDPFGTIMLPLMLYFTAGMVFGWAKPVPIDQRRFSYPRFDMIMVALAGPLSNFILACIGFLIFASFSPLSFSTEHILTFFIIFNLSIGLFNLIPILPLDGGRILGELLPRPLAYHWAKLEAVGMFIIFTLLIIIPQIEKFLNVNIFSFHIFLLDSIRIILDKYEYAFGVKLFTTL
jgi:Zn-dependent protease